MWLQGCNNANSVVGLPPQTLFLSNGSVSGAIAIFALPLTTSSTATGGLAGAGFKPSGMCVGPGGMLLSMGGSAQVWLAPVNGASSTFTIPIASGSADCAFDASGNLYIAQSGAVAVYPSFHQGSAAGTPITSGISGPIGVATDPAGNVYVASLKTITIYSSLASGNALQHTLTGANGARGVKIGPDGNMYAAGFSDPAKIDVILPPFLNSSTFDHQLSPPGAIFCTYMALDRAGSLYAVCVTGSTPFSAVYVYTPPYSGAPLELDTAGAIGIAIR
jgi:streptogramin lyase